MGRKRKDVEFWDAARLNTLTYEYYYRYLTEIATTCFDWKNLPPEIDVRFMELTLYRQGHVLFFYDDGLGEYLCLTATLHGRWDVYNRPTEREAYASNDYQNGLSYKNSVIIYNNYLRCATQLDMEMYARRLMEIERTIDVNVRGQKTPKVLTCQENQRLVLENLYMQYSGNFPFIFGDKKLDFQGLNTLDTTSPYVSDKLQILKRQILNEALTFLGIENNSNEKAERLVENESVSNLGAVQANRNARLAARQQACREINKMFGLNISVEYKNPLSIDRGEETASGEIHNGNPDNL